ncbi:UDP-N-acetylmuramate dehydrogenase [Rodentibacter caecimuris]|uniref:UDP-N-acetylenolpyruvoylglucosamine reductase n=1 Tax=Rodentibacter caecimuris TaxID=1796644 RepID=A0ABX3L095_9PAST|nr:UDP-N-acetylenolpyruvoylglucosamine reductase [Rodentibacter heylii]
MQNLQPFHTFHISVNARQIINIYNIEQLKTVWQEASQQGLPILFLGQGSNILFLEDFKGTVLINCLKGISHKQDNSFHYLHIQAGENWHNLVEWSLSQGINGLENLALIPGCAGSAPIQNIGAYGVEFKDVCDYVDVLNLHNGRTFRLSTEQCKFGYRDSIFKHQYAKGYIITAVGLKLAKKWIPILKYGSLVNFDQRTVKAQQIFEEVCKIRQSKLPNPDQFGNAGSFFKNPLVSAAQFIEIKKLAENIPHFPQSDGSIKLAAGWLIDQCGLKGMQIGGAAVHQLQALVLINKAQASGQDVLHLASFVYKQVLQKFGVALESEVRFIAAEGEVNSTTLIAQTQE